MCYEEMGRPREAIECLKRALLGADPGEIQIKLKLARLYDEIDDRAAAALQHQRVVEICIAEGRPMHTFARSCIYVARYDVEHERNLLLAKAYLERVASSNAEEVAVATEMLRDLMAKMGSNVNGGNTPPSEVVPQSAATDSTLTSGESAAPAPST